MKFKSEKWELFLNDPSKKKCLKYKTLEKYVYEHLDRAPAEGEQVPQSTQPTVEQSQAEEEADAEMPDSQQSFTPTNFTPENSSILLKTPQFSRIFPTSQVR